MNLGFVGVFILSFPFLALGITWNGEEGSGCDFAGFDLKSAFTTRSRCLTACRQTALCTHYTWTSYNGGTCWMKYGRGSKNLAIAKDSSFSCGVLANTVSWNGDSGVSCDFEGKDLSSARTSSTSCRSRCSLTSGCTHYTWTDYNGGTCWMKNGAASKSDAFFSNDGGMVCGIISGGGGGGGGGQTNPPVTNPPVTNPPVTNPPTGGVTISFNQFSSAITRNGYPAPRQDQYNAFVGGISYSKISTVRELAMMLAHVIHETGGLTKLREEYCLNTNCASAYPPTGPGGVIYFGRGYLQITWNYNYQAASQDIFGDSNVLLNNPDSVATDESLAWKTAFWYWKTSVHTVAAVTQGYFGASTKAINGALECTNGGNSQARTRFAYYKVVLNAFGVNETPIEGGCYN